MQSIIKNSYNPTPPSMLASLSIRLDVLTQDILALPLITLVLV
jgi:hypothetical protein